MKTVFHIAGLKQVRGNGALKLDRSLGYRLLLFFNLVITFRVMLLSNIGEIMGILELGYLAVLFFYLCLRMMQRSFDGNFRIDDFEVLIILLTLLPFISAIAAKMEFDQPVLFGVLAFKDFFLIYGALLTYQLLRSGKVNLKMMEQAMLDVAWFNLLFFYVMSLFTDPSAHIDTILAGTQAAKGGDVYYRFSMAFIFFGAIYYVIKAFYERNWIWLLAAGMFAVYVVFFRMDRTSIAVLLGVIGLFWLLQLKPRAKLRTIVGLILPGIFLLLVGFLAVPEVFMKYTAMFDDALSTLLGEPAISGQSWLRLHEAEIAEHFIEKNPWIGSGRISNQWVDGAYNHFFGFFYPSDVGVIGQIFMYGFPGAILLYSQFGFAAFYLRKLKHQRSSLFMLALKYYLIVLFLDGLTNGSITIYAAQSVTVIMVIFYVYRKARLEHQHNFTIQAHS